MVTPRISQKNLSDVYRLELISKITARENDDLVCVCYDTEEVPRIIWADVVRPETQIPCVRFMQPTTRCGVYPVTESQIRAIKKKTDKYGVDDLFVYISPYVDHMMHNQRISRIINVTKNVFKDLEMINKINADLYGFSGFYANWFRNILFNISLKHRYNIIRHIFNYMNVFGSIANDSASSIIFMNAVTSYINNLDFDLYTEINRDMFSLRDETPWPKKKYMSLYETMNNMLGKINEPIIKPPAIIDRRAMNAIWGILSAGTPHMDKPEVPQLRGVNNLEFQMAVKMCIVCVMQVYNSFTNKGEMPS